MRNVYLLQTFTGAQCISVYTTHLRAVRAYKAHCKLLNAVPQKFSAYKYAQCSAAATTCGMLDTTTITVLTLNAALPVV